MSLPPDALAASALEQALGDSADRLNPFGWNQALALDEREAFPEPLVNEATRLGVLRHFVPKRDGGRLGSVTEAALMLRAVARRDLTAAIALGQAFLGSVPVWLAGSAQQRARQAQALEDGKLAALALTEEAHGSDLLATETRATSGALTGTKWLINNATRAELVTVLARTNAQQGLSSLSLCQFDKPAATGFRTLPKILTHGIRGADISGITFDQASPVSLIGNEGTGMTLTLKALQVTRIGCAAFSLGAADTALRLALDFALDRKLYGATAFDIPHVKAVLTKAFVELLEAEAVAIAGWRGLHLAPEQMALCSAVVKYFVPTRCEQIIRDVAVVFGARHWLRANVFQKLMRDASVVSLFDGSTAVNLEGIGLQLARLEPKAPDAQRSRLRFDVSAPVPDFTGDGLELMGPGFDDVLSGPIDAPDRADRRSARAFELSAAAAAQYAAACAAALPSHADATERLLELHHAKRWFSHFAIPLH